MMLWPCSYSPLGASPRRKLHTLSSIGPHIWGKSAHVAAATTTAVCVGSTVLTVTSTVMARSLRRSHDAYLPHQDPHRLPDRACPPRAEHHLASAASGTLS